MNATSGLGMVHLIVDITNEKNLIESLQDCINMDSDLSENEDYFQDDTLELGFDNEVERIVKESFGECGFTCLNDIKTIEDVNKLFTKVTDAISKQEYFCVCNLDIIELGDNKFAVAFAYGGNYD